MKRTLPTLLALSLLLSSLFTFGTTFAQTSPLPDDQSADLDVDDAAPVSRVARLSFVDGDVSFLRAGVTEWAPGVENLPLLEGDQIYTGAGARAEIQFARGNYIRLSEKTELTITDLSDTAAQLEIPEGTAIIRLERLATVFQRFEVDTPNSAVLVLQDGLYRVEVGGEMNSEFIVRRGEAEVSTEEGSFKVREGHKLLVDTATTGRIELAIDTSTDDWDQWSSDRDTTIARADSDPAPDYVATYETANNDFYGVSDLSSYGTWTNYSSYGQCWIPRVGSDWAPYRSGQWLWIPAAGWTWLSSEPWGWAPYHYGRWSYLSGLGWAWIPGFGSGYRGYGYRDYRWRPALVYFFNCPTPRGHYVGWYPLAPGERWLRHDRRSGVDRARVRFPRKLPRLDDGRSGTRASELHHGMTILPAEGFARKNRSGVRPAAPTRELSDLISKDVRSGLPDIKPSPVAAAPEFAENDRRRSRRIAVPANEVIRRPVVTRNPKVDAPSGTAVARERRVISPRKTEIDTQGPILRQRGSERGFERRAKPTTESADSTAPDPAPDRQSRKPRIQLPSPSEKGNSDGAAGARRHTREGGTAVDSGSNNSAKEERRRPSQEQSQEPKQKESFPSTGPRRDEARPREKRPPTIDSKPREDAPQRSRNENSPRSQDRVAPAPRVEPKPERPHSDNQARPEQHQQKEQRQERQQQSEQRKKP
ncbi:MAG TPA: DUF6600 domain-containing protein [Blastocatellia bacterium]|nr:DUF6600 domain-containing protein [Blastocatellia bacterium]